MPAATKATSNGAGATTLTIPKPSIKTVTIEVEGISPLICNRWSEKAKRAMLDKQMKKASKAREAKDPEADFRASLYELETEDEGARFGFPSVAFKAAAVRAGKQVGLVMADLRTWFHVSGELVPIKGEPRMREDMVRVQQTSDIRYRGEFPEWTAKVQIELDESKFSVEQLVSLFDGAGFGVGVGEWRPEKDGQYGRFQVKEVTVS